MNQGVPAKKVLLFCIDVNNISVLSRRQKLFSLSFSVCVYRKTFIGYFQQLTPWDIGRKFEVHYNAIILQCGNKQNIFLESEKN